MSDSPHTKDQHFVPRTYLQGFSSDSRSIYEYNLRLDTPIDRPVSIESVCKEKYLYEIRDEQGQIINVNFIENALCHFEGEFADYRRRLLRKAVHKENYKTKCFLTREERDFWAFYSTLHIMRNPITLTGIKEIIQDETQDRFSDQEARNIAVAYCLPFFKKPEKGDLNALTFFLSMLRETVLTVGFAETDNLFTSDHAMYGSRKPDEDLLHFQRLWFPVSSDCALIFSNPTLIDRDKRNRLIPLSEEEIAAYNNGIAYIAAQMVLSKHPFSDADIALIRAARRERERAESQNQEI